MHADGQRTPADLSQLLGRAGYATIQELRRLGRQGLLEMPPPADPPTDPDFVRLPRARGPYADRERPPVTATTYSPKPPGVPIVPGSATEPPAASKDPPAPVATNPVGTPDRPPRLARRKPNAHLPKGVAPADADTPTHQGTDEVLLKRIRTALRALR
jgi:hypothetical protein